MTLFYRAVQSTTVTKAGDKKWHLNLVEIDEAVSTQQLTEMIAEKSSLTPGDVHSVVQSLMTVIRNGLLNSKAVYLEELGTLTVKAHSHGRGVDKEEDVNPDQAGALLCHFAPEQTRPTAIGTARASFRGVEFQKIGSIGTLGGNGSGNDDGDIVDNPTA